MIDGLRRLNETYFKYQSGWIEMNDRLTFLTIANRTDPLPRPFRSSTSSLYCRSMSSTEVMKELAKLNQPKISRNLFASSICLT